MRAPCPPSTAPTRIACESRGMLTVDLALRRVDDRSPSPTPHSLPAHHHHHPRARARLPTSLLTVNVPAPAPASFIQSAPKPRWRSTEFRLYYAVFALVVPAMVRVACRATSRCVPPPPLSLSSCTDLTRPRRPTQPRPASTPSMARA